MWEQKRRIDRLMETGQLDRALSELDFLVKVEGESAFAHNKRGVIAARQGELGRAKAYFEKALALDQRFVQAYSNLGNIYREAGDLDRAVEFYQQAIRWDPEYGTAYHNLGVVYKQKGDLHKAVEHLKKASRLQRTIARRELAEVSPVRRNPATWLWIALLIALLLYYRART